MEIDEKVCGKCGISKCMNEFTVNLDSKDGYHSTCKKCKKLSDQKRYQNKKKTKNEKNEKDEYEEYKKKWFKDAEKYFNKCLVMDYRQWKNEMLNKFSLMDEVDDKYNRLDLGTVNIDEDEETVLAKIQSAVLDEMKKMLMPNEVKIETKDDVRNFYLPFNLTKEIKQKLQKDLI